MNRRAMAALFALLLTGRLVCPSAFAGEIWVFFENIAATQRQELTSPGPEPEFPEETPWEPPGQETPETTIELSGSGQPAEEAIPEPTSSNKTPPEDDGCSTVEELVERISRDEGGIVTVTGDLVLEEGDDVRLEVRTPVVIELGPYGITVPKGAALAMSGPITLTGRGAPNPLLTISGFLTAENGTVVSATGERAVAVCLKGGGWNPNPAIVSAVGTGACAVEADGVERLDLYQLQLTARGENAVCARASVPVRMILCRAESEGALVDAPALTLDGTAADPEPGNAQIIRRTAGPANSLPENGLCIPVGASDADLAELLTQRLGNSSGYGLYDSAGKESALFYWAAAAWAGGPVDLMRPGVSWFTGTPVDRMVGAVALPEHVVPVYVVDPGSPWIQDAEKMGESVFLRFFRSIEGADSVTLWYSMDGGARWADAIELPGASVTTTGATVEALPRINHDYLFRLEVTGGPMAGSSNILPFAYYDDRSWNGGGDWDGGDWDGEAELPGDNSAQPPDWGPELSDPPSKEDPAWGEMVLPEPTPAPPKIVITYITPTPAPEPMPVPEPMTQPEPPTPAPEPIPVPEPPTQPEPPTPALEPTPVPEPMPLSTPTPVPPVPTLPEGVTASLTGRDLKAQRLANPGGVTLAGNGVKVTLPSALTDAMGLEPESVLAVRLDMPGPDSFEIRFWVDGREVAEFGGGTFAVTVPVEDMDGASYFCTAPDGRETEASSLMGSRAEFELAAAGVYTISAAAREPAAPQPTGLEEPAVSAEPDGQAAPVLLPALGAGVLVVTAALLLLIRRRGGR